MTESLLFYPLCAVAITLVGISKSGFGGALGFIAVPTLMLFVSPFDALAIMLPILCLMDLFALKQHWRRWSRDVIKVIVPGGLLGVFFGAVSFFWWDARSIRLFIGVMAVGFCLYHWLGGSHAFARQRLSARWGVGLSALSGFTSCVAHAGGPPLLMYLLPYRLDKRVYTASIAVYFFAVNFSKLIPYAHYGLFSFEALKVALFFTPCAPLGAWLGMWLHRRVNEVWFYRLCYAALFVLGAKLIADVVVLGS